jgi:hypothetical protein
VILVDTGIDVSLSHCSAQDAEAVFQSLARHFSAQAGTTDPARTPAAGKPVVWSGRFDTHDPLRAPDSGAGQLRGPVSLRLSGAPDAVRQAREAIDGDFAAEYLGTTLGDQEVEVSLRLG